MSSSLGFVILRYVNSAATDKYWQECYASVRRFYPEHKIVIIDDNSAPEFVSSPPLYNTEIVQSEYPAGRGEVLPYHYFYKHHWFDVAVFLHDSAFIQREIAFDVLENSYQPLWHFEHWWNSVSEEKAMIYKLDNCNELIDVYDNKDRWRGCFGGMCVITHAYLTRIYERYNMSVLLDCIRSRVDRMVFERVIGTLLHSGRTDPAFSKYGYIHDYNHHRYKYSYANYVDDKQNNRIELPIAKIFCDR